MRRVTTATKPRVTRMTGDADRRSVAGAASMLYSSGTTGKPKGVKHRLLLPEEAVSATNVSPLVMIGQGLFKFSPDMIYLSPAPLYHAAPLALVDGGAATGRHRDRHGTLRCGKARWNISRRYQRDARAMGADALHPDAQAARRGARTRYDTSRRSEGGMACRRAVPGAGEGENDRMVGADRRRILRGHRGQWLHTRSHRR